MNRPQLPKAAFTEAAQHIINAQQPNGSFISLSSASSDYSSPLSYQTTFFSSNILAALAVTKEPNLLQAQQKSVAFLLNQKSPQWSFNYWDRESAEFSRLPYPDDLDDTFCALAALCATDPQIITGQALAHAVDLLTATEMKPGGPYRTWLVTKQAETVWQDVDLAVNANVAWFLAQQKVHLPDLTAFIDRSIEEQNFHSSYYPTIFPVTYFITRSYQGKVQQQLKNFLLEQINLPKELNPLDLALLISALLRLGTPPSELNTAVDQLLSATARGFQPYPFCLDPSQNGQKYFAASSALTAAFCLEALTLYQQKAHTQVDQKSDSKADRVYLEVKKRAEQYFSSLPKSLSLSAQEVLTRTLQSDLDRQIVLLPHWFAQALRSTSVRIELVTLCGLANLYGWIAYTIYDNVIDDAQQTALLPLANICLRQVVDIYTTGPNRPFSNLFHTIMDRMEGANAWEVDQTRVLIKQGQIDLPKILPDYLDYSILADKSLGHALGPLYILCNAGFKEQSLEVTQTLDMLRHFLIARQLNDDAHDWQDDLNKGQLNSAAVLVIRQAQEQNVVGKDRVDLAATLSELQQTFWHKTIFGIGDLITFHAAQARAKSRQLQSLVDPLFIHKLLKPLETAAKTAQTEASRAKDFLSVYGQK